MQYASLHFEFIKLFFTIPYSLRKKNQESLIGNMSNSQKNPQALFLFIFGLSMQLDSYLYF